VTTLTLIIENHQQNSFLSWFTSWILPSDASNCLVKMQIAQILLQRLQEKNYRTWQLNTEDAIWMKLIQDT